MGISTRRARACAHAILLVGSFFILALVSATPTWAANPLDSLAFVYDDGMGHTLPYRLFLPPGYDDPGAEFPLVLFLHGAGERGNDNTAQVTNHINGLIDATQSERYASFLLAPQAPTGGSWSSFGPGNDLNISMQLVTDVIAQLESQYQIDTSRRYVTGLSMGGYGTFDLIAKRPGMFAAALPLSGGGDPYRAADIAQTPTWIVHGHSDNVVPPSASRYVSMALDAIDADSIYLEVSGQHAIWDPIYTDATDEFYPWLFEGVEPPLATLIYNSLTGNVKIDATTAPGGAIELFRIRTRDPLNLIGAPTEIDGIELQHPIPQYAVYDGRNTGGFDHVADLGNIFPTGLDLNTLADSFVEFMYQSPTLPRVPRTFRFQIVVPEPGIVTLLLGAVPLLLIGRRSRVR
ncbi:MAG: hypothetical protein KDA63_11960 [Planctomycetales bacterium]|nr:hypothetical protein [Planctomycetales bacterium]